MYRHVSVSSPCGVSRAVDFCVSPNSGRAPRVAVGMNPDGATPGSGTHFNTFNSTPDDESRAHHRDP
eukprot:5797215-Prymnesium_polylepis.1